MACIGRVYKQRKQMAGGMTTVGTMGPSTHAALPVWIGISLSLW
jgi:hypothetical protein